MGFRAIISIFNKVLTLVCLGDEPCHETSEDYVKNTDWLLSEAFCLRSEKELFHPYEKKHSTAYDAGQTAESYAFLILSLIVSECTGTRFLGIWG